MYRFARPSAILVDRDQGVLRAGTHTLQTAAAVGKAVLGTDISGLRDAVRDGETGLLVPAGDVVALAEGMRSLLADDERRQRLGNQGREWARCFDWNRLAKDQEGVYLRALGEISGV